MRSDIFITSRMSCSTSTTRDALRRDFLDHGVDLGRLDRVAAGGGLVEQNDLRLGRERARDLQPLERAVGERAGGAIREAAQADKREQILRLPRACARFCRHTDGSETRWASTLRFSCRCRPTITFSTAVMRKNTCRF